jgi:hypothetical protein
MLIDIYTVEFINFKLLKKVAPVILRYAEYKTYSPNSEKKFYKFFHSFSDFFKAFQNILFYALSKQIIFNANFVESLSCLYSELLVLPLTTFFIFLIFLCHN